MRTDTLEFEATWGKKPRGFGLWCFIVNGYDEKGHEQTERFFENGTLTEAKQKACRQFKGMFDVKRIETVKVMP
jgi:hypothetical protein